MASEINNKATGPIPKPTKKPKAAPKPIRKSGKVAQAWAAKKKQWFKDNPPNHQGFYTCGICLLHVHKDSVDLDHIVNRSVAPGRRYDDDNLQPVHPSCNENKKLGLVRQGGHNAESK